MRTCIVASMASLLLACRPVMAGSEKGTYELVGVLVPGEPGMFRAAYPTVLIHSLAAPFSTRAMANSKGQFKLKNLPTGMYNLVAIVPQVRILRRTVDIGPSFADAQGKIYLKIPFNRPPPNRMRYTISAAQLAIPESTQSEYRRCQEYLEKGNLDRSAACLKDVLETTPQFAAAWNSLGSIASRSGKLEDAEACYKEALNHTPGSFRTLMSLGGTLISRNKTKESLEVFLQAVKARPDDPEAQARLGLSYLLLDKPDQAKEHLEEAKKLEPGHFTCPQLLLAQIYTRRGDVAAAITELEGFIKLHPDLEMTASVRESIKQLRAP